MDEGTSLMNAKTCGRNLRICGFYKGSELNMTHFAGCSVILFVNSNVIFPSLALEAPLFMVNGNGVLMMIKTNENMQFYHTLDQPLNFFLWRSSHTTFSCGNGSEKITIFISKSSTIIIFEVNILSVKYTGI